MSLAARNVTKKFNYFSKSVKFNHFLYHLWIPKHLLRILFTLFIFRQRHTTHPSHSFTLLLSYSLTLSLSHLLLSYSLTLLPSHSLTSYSLTLLPLTLSQSVALPWSQCYQLPIEGYTPQQGCSACLGLSFPHTSHILSSHS